MENFRNGKFSRRDIFKLAATASISMEFPRRGFGTPRQPKDRPNILFLIAGQHRGNCLGCDGNRAVRTPNLDSDPQELRYLASDSAQRNQLRLWRGRMVEHLRERGEDWVKNGRLMVRQEGMPISPNYPRTEAKRAALAPVRHNLEM